MKLYVTLTKMKLAALFCTVAVAVAVTGQALSPPESGLDGSTAALRAEFIQGLGLDAGECILTKKVTVPRVFGDVYENYNKMQKNAGFDLSPYKGKTVTLYSYDAGEGLTVNLLVADGAIIGGDISTAEIDGNMRPLK